MSTRHSDLVVATGRKSGEKKASKGKGKRKLKHMVIRPVNNGGFVTEKHFQDDEKEPWNNPPEEQAHEDRDGMMDHVEDTFPEGEASDNDNDSGNDGQAAE